MLLYAGAGRDDTGCPVTILQIYLRMPKGMEDNVSAAFHLLGHCYLRLGMADKAQQFFIAVCVCVTSVLPSEEANVHADCVRAAVDQFRLRERLADISGGRGRHGGERRTGSNPLSSSPQQGEDTYL